MRLSLLIICCLLTVPLSAQKLSGTWIMAYLKAKQPVYTMVDNNGQLELDESAEADSTITYNAGLMSLIMDGRDRAKSYSWDGEESWSVKQSKDQITFFGKIDTLYGQFTHPNELVLKSTIDDIPTEYIFHPVTFKQSKTALDIEKSSWFVGGEESYLKGQRINFQTDSVLTTTTGNTESPGEFYIHPLDNHNAIEFVVNTPANHIGILYLTEIKKTRIKGIFYPLVEAGAIPKRTIVQLKRIRH